MRIQIVLQNSSPYHSSQPGEDRVNIKGQPHTPTPSNKGFPCIKTRQIPFVTPGNGNGDGGLSTVPVMPANSLRHDLRDKMLGHVMRELKGKATLSVAAYAAAYSGNASGNPEGKPASFNELVMVRNHPFLGLFGGGPRMIPGRLRVDSAYAITTRYLPHLGDFVELAAGGKLTDTVFTRRVDPVLKGNEDNMSIIEDPVASITEWSNQFTKKGGDSEETSDEIRGLNSFTAHEFVIPGVNWLWRVSVDNPTPAQVGMVLIAIQEMNDSFIGGMGRIGYGNIKVRSVLVDGKELWAGKGLNENNTLVQDGFAAMAEALDSITGEQFETFATKREVAPKKKAAKEPVE